MSRKEKIDNLWLKGTFGWRLVKRGLEKDGKSVYDVLPPKGDERERWAALWEYVPYFCEDTKEIAYYALYPHWFEEEFSKDMNKK